MQKRKFVMFTGDSVTDCERARPIGDGFGYMGNSYVSRIFVDTWADDPMPPIHYLNSATSGDTTERLLARFDSEVLFYRPDYLFIMIGINDAWRHFDGYRLSNRLIFPEESAANMEQMLQKTIAAGCVPVILSPIFVEGWREDPMRRMVDDISARFRALAEKYHIGYIDIQAKVDEYLKVGSPYVLSQDRVHPKAVGNALIARTIENDPAFRVIFDD